MNYGINPLHYLHVAFLVYTVHARVLHAKDIQYMFVKRNIKNWEKNATERNRTGDKTQRNETGEETLRNRTEQLVRSNPVFTERASRSTNQTGGGNFFTHTVYCHVKYSKNCYLLSLWSKSTWSS